MNSRRRPLRGEHEEQDDYIRNIDSLPVPCPVCAHPFPKVDAGEGDRHCCPNCGAALRYAVPLQPGVGGHPWRWQIDRENDAKEAT